MLHPLVTESVLPQARLGPVLPVRMLFVHSFGFLLKGQLLSLVKND
jgi:hypothetical protein